MQTNAPEGEVSVDHRKNSVPPELVPYCWRPGQSGNPNGRPAGPSLKHALRELLRAHPELLNQITQSLVDKARRGSLQAIRVIAELLDDGSGHAVVTVQNHVSVPTLNLTREQIDAILLERFRNRLASEPETLLQGLSEQERGSLVSRLTALSSSPPLPVPR